jgi:hypothetical protein
MTISKVCRAVGISAAAAILAGCVGIHSIVPQAPMQAPSVTSRNALGSASPSYIQGDGMLKGEKFLSRKASNSCGSGLGAGFLKFRATGKASGPFPGTFTLSGKAVNGGRYFNETFTIKSGAQTISGSTGSDARHGSWYCGKYGHATTFEFSGIVYNVGSSKGNTSLKWAWALHLFSQTLNT